MKHVLCIVTLASLLSAVAGTLHAASPSEYSYVSPGMRTDLLVEEFTDNANGWAVGTFGEGVRRGSIENGYYLWESLKGEGSPSSWRTGPINTDYDFEIETRIRFVRGIPDNANGIFWGRNGEGHRHRFCFDGNGQYMIDQFDGKWTTFVSWTKSPLVSASKYNKFTLRKVGNTLYYFIAETLVHTMPVRPFFGQMIGFQANDLSTIHVDNLRLSYLNLPAAANYYHFWSKPRLDAFLDEFTDNINGWPTGIMGDSAKRGAVENGRYVWQSLKEGENPMAWQIVPVTQSADFEIEAKIEFVNGEDNNANGIFWGRNASNHRYHFGFSGNGQFKIYKYDGTWLDFIPWSALGLVKKKGYNTLTVRKIGRVSYFFLNQKLVYLMPFQPFFGDMLGFQVNQNSTIHVDSLRVSYLE